MAGLQLGAYDLELRKNLERLSPGVLDNIINKVLADQPFSKVHNLCSICRKWRDHYLISNRYLLYFDTGHLLLFNVGRAVWETVSIEFCRFEGDRVLSLVAADGVLLCFTTVTGKLFVCNPFTKSWRKLPSLPPEFLRIRGIPPLVGTNSRHGMGDVVAGMIVNSDNGQFKLVVAVELLTHRQTATYDSRNNSWSQVREDHLPQECQQFLASPQAKHMRNLYCASCNKRAGYNPSVFYVLRYNPEQHVWKSINTSDNGIKYIPTIMLERGGRVIMGSISGDDPQEALMGRVTRDDSIKLFEVQNTGELSLESLFSFALEDIYDTLVLGISENLRRLQNFRLMYIAGEGVVYFVGILRRYSVELSAAQISVNVVMHNLMDHSNLVFAWAEWPEHFIFNGRGLSQERRSFPLWENFHNFRPSLKFCNRPRL